MAVNKLELPPPLVDSDTTTWNRFKNGLREAGFLSVKYPDDKFTIDQVKTWIENAPNMIKLQYNRAFENIIPKSEHTDVLLEWLRQEIEAVVGHMSQNNYYPVWNRYERSLYYGFRKYIGERTLKKSEKTVVSLGLNRTDSSVVLYVTSSLTEENRKKVVEYFVDQKKATKIIVASEN